MLLRTELMNPDGNGIDEVLISAYREFGTPAVLRVPDAPPFVLHEEVGGMSSIFLFTYKQGIEWQRVRDRRESMVKRLAREVVDAKLTARAQQTALDNFRQKWAVTANDAIDGDAPADRYHPSTGTYPRERAARVFNPLTFSEVRRVDKDGMIDWGKKKGQRVYVSKALYGERIELIPDIQAGTWLVQWHDFSLGELASDRATKLEQMTETD
jgi:hypothetical protein